MVLLVRSSTNDPQLPAMTASYTLQQRHRHAHSKKIPHLLQADTGLRLSTRCNEILRNMQIYHNTGTMYADFYQHSKDILVNSV